jgi:hypothetical protein
MSGVSTCQGNLKSYKRVIKAQFIFIGTAGTSDGKRVALYQQEMY